MGHANSLLSGLPDCTLGKPQVAQNSAALIVSRTCRKQHKTSVLEQVHWLPVRQHIAYKIFLLSYQSLNSVCVPQYLKDMLGLNQRCQLRSNSSMVRLTAPKTKKIMGDRSFAAWAPRLWNSLSVGLRNSDSHCDIEFKKSVKTLLFNNTFR